MEQMLPIQWPAGGLVEGWSFSDQPEGTAREYTNVRFQDKRGRLRGAQRSGLSKYNANPLDAVGTKSVGLTSLFVDNRHVSYTAIASGSETTTWDKATPAGGVCRNVKVDRQGNVYALSGNAAVVKYSADGEKLWELSVPVADPLHVIRALAVDVTDIVYVGVSEGGQQKKAKLFAFEQIPDNKTEKLWEVETNAYIEDMKIAQDALYTCQNESDRNRAMVRVYDFIDSADPEQIQEYRVPYPVNSIAVKSDGSVFVACEPSGDTDNHYWRLPDATFPEFSIDSEVWSPYLLENYDRRVWSWYVGDDIDESDVSSDFLDGVQILRWRDRTRRQRHLGADLRFSNEGPVLAKDGLLKHQAVRFNRGGNNSSPPLQGFKTLRNSSYSVAFADQQRTMVPAYSTNQWTMYMVLRLSSNDPVSDSRGRVIWGQTRDNDGTSGRHHMLLQNRNADSTAGQGTVVPGVFCHYSGPSGASGGSGGGGQPDEASFQNANQTVIVGMQYDGGVVGGPSSYFEVNGEEIDTYTGSSTNFTLSESWLGYFREPGGDFTFDDSSGCLGDVVEIICFDRKDRNDDTAGILSSAERQAVIGYLAHKHGVQHLLPASNDYSITGSSPDELSGPPDKTGTVVSAAQALANKRFGCVVKYNAEGQIIWTANEMELESGSRSGGYGYAVAVNSDGNVYSLGPSPTGAAGNTVQVRMIIDSGTDFSIDTADGAWSSSYPSDFDQTYKYPRVDVDEFDNFYLPFPSNGGVIAGFRVYKKDGTLLHDGITGPETASFAVAVDRRIPDYRSDLTTKRAEHIIVATNQAEVDTSNLFKMRLVSASQESGAIHELHIMGVSGGNIVRFTDAAVTTPTDGSGALDSDARYVQAAVLYRKAYWTDGRQYRVYSPISNIVAEYTCKSSGEMPARCALIESWRGRIVLARSADEPHNWFMSAKDEPDNYDYFPPVPNETQAVAGNNSTAGLCPDIINSVVPYSEDILVFGGDHSIWALIGDPAAGGRLELVSDITGMAFGRPWCKDPNGVLYFLGSRGGFFRWLPGGKPERLSLYKIERQLQEIDFSSYHVKLAWNYQDEGIHIFQCPFGAGGTPVSHWFWEAKPDAFAKDTIGQTGHTNMQPTDVIVIDGDEFADRVLLLGCEDGYIRQWDKDSKSDDTRSDGVTKQAINAVVTIFPLPSGESANGMEIQFQGLTVILGDADDGARYELFASDEPDSIPVAERTGVLGPGRNPPKWDRIVGPYCGLRLRNSAPDESFAFERAYITAIPAGMVRPRMVN